MFRPNMRFAQSYEFFWPILRFFYLMIARENHVIWTIIRLDSMFFQMFSQKIKKNIFTILLLLLLYYWYIVITVKFLIHFYYYFIIISLLFQFIISIIYLHYSLSLKFSHFFLLQEQWELQWLPFFLQLPLLQFFSSQLDSCCHCHLKEEILVKSIKKVNSNCNLLLAQC